MHERLDDGAGRIRAPSSASLVDESDGGLAQPVLWWHARRTDSSETCPRCRKRALPAPFNHRAFGSHADPAGLQPRRGPGLKWPRHDQEGRGQHRRGSRWQPARLNPPVLYKAQVRFDLDWDWDGRPADPDREPVDRRQGLRPTRSGTVHRARGHECAVSLQRAADLCGRQRWGGDQCPRVMHGCCLRWGVRSPGGAADGARRRVRARARRRGGGPVESRRQWSNAAIHAPSGPPMAGTARVRVDQGVPAPDAALAACLAAPALLRATAF